MGREAPVTDKLRTRDTILAELATFPTEFERLVIRPYDRDDLLHPAADGGWGVVEIVPHLRDWDEIWYDRVVAIIESDMPRLPAFDDALWDIERDYRGQDPLKSLAEFSAQRARFVAFLKELPAETWQREGAHAALGPISIHWITNQVCTHDREHLQEALDAVVS